MLRANVGVMSEREHYPMQLKSTNGGIQFRFGSNVPFQTAWRFEGYRPDQRTGKLYDLFERAMDATKQAEASAAYRIEQLSLRIHLVSEIVERNYIDLIDVIEEYDIDEDFSRDTTADWAVEFTRHLIAYLGSVKNREYQTQSDFLPELDRMCTERPFVSENYQKQIKHYDVDLHGSFFSSLRNMIVHDGVPETVLHHDMDSDQMLVGLNKDTLLRNDNFTAKAKGYADSYDDFINMSEAIETYHSSVDKLYTWLFTVPFRRLEDRYSESVSEFSRAEEYQQDFFDESGHEFTELRWLTSDESE